MYLSKIELYGFKSFAHRVRITFDKGLTAIVGPNGCGKTNVVDAIRWVLGEQRSTLLRSPKMESIIFNGTKNLRPLSFTEVSLTIQNTRNVLPTEYTEVTITRRVYRNGESDYLLNKVPCRLRDILDLFADTGMGSDAYSVIELKMIEEIISNKSEERLKLFEEAAGITRYKQRRKQTFKQLESTALDLSRVDDVLAEVEKKVRSLRQQVKKANRLKELRNEMKELDLTLSGLEMAEHREKLKPLIETIAGEELRNQELATRIAQCDSVHQQAELQQLDLEKELAEAQKLLNETGRRVHALEKQLLQQQEKNKSLLISIDRSSRAIDEKKINIIGQEAITETLSAQCKPMEQACSLLFEQFEELKTGQESLNASLDHHRRELLDERMNLAGHQKSLNALNITKQALETNKEHLTSSIQLLDKKRAELELLLERSIPARQEIAGILAEKTALIDMLDKEEQHLIERKSRLLEKIELLKDSLLDLRSMHDKLHNQITLADSILETFEGLPEGIPFLEKQGNRKAGLGCLSDLLSINTTDRKAVYAALGASLGFYVCSTLQEAKTAISNLTKADKGKIHFLVLELIDRNSPEEYPSIDGARKTIEAIEFPPELSLALRMILGKSHIVQDLPAAEQLAADYPDALFITLEGETFSGRGIMSGGSTKGNEGIRLGKKNERELLQKELLTTTGNIAETENTLNTLKKELDTIRAEENKRSKSALGEEIATLEKKLTRIDIEDQSRKKELEKIADETTAMHRRLNGVEEELMRMRPDIALLEERIGTLQERLHAMQELLSGEEIKIRNLNVEAHHRQGRYRDALLEQEKIVFRIKACREKTASLTEELTALQQEVISSEQAMADLDTSIRQIAALHEEALMHSCSQQQELNELETTCRELQLRNHDTLSALRDLRRKHDLGLQMLAEFNAQKIRIEHALDHIRTRSMERYNSVPNDLPALLPKGFDRRKAAERLEYLQHQKEQFGAVNELALEEYENEHERFEFLRAQKEDLVRAEEQLRSTIDEINKTALQRFQKTCTEVRKNFIRIFHDLFDPEDEVDLLVHSHEDPLEAQIEIVARPRGKKPLAIEQLSGGEKALTALSLLFAIYLVKPSPFCILDEVDAPLDDANVGRFIKLLKKFENNTQFIIVTHNKKSMASCHALYGVTMEEEGVSKLIPVKLS